MKYVIIGVVAALAIGLALEPINKAFQRDPEIDEYRSMLPRPTFNPTSSPNSTSQGTTSTSFTQQPYKKQTKEKAAVKNPISWKTFIKRWLLFLCSIFAILMYVCFYQVPHWLAQGRELISWLWKDQMPNTARNALLISALIGIVEGCSGDVQPLMTLAGKSTDIGLPGFLMPCLTGGLVLIVAFLTAYQGKKKDDKVANEVVTSVLPNQ